MNRQFAISLLVLAGLLLFPGLGASLPPSNRVMSQLEHFRSATEDVAGRGRLTYGPIEGQPVRFERHWNQAPRLGWGDTDLELSWNDSRADIVLRLAGAGLAAADLEEALGAMGRSLEPTVDSLVFLGDDPVLVIGGAQGALAARLYVQRDNYRLRRVDLPMPEGVYQLDLDDYTLAEGWFPRTIVVSRDGRTLFRLELESLSRLDRSER